MSFKILYHYISFSWKDNTRNAKFGVFFLYITSSSREDMHKLKFGLNKELGFLGNWPIHSEILNTLGCFDIL